MTIITKLPKEELKFFGRFTFDLNPQLLILPVITIKYQDEDCDFLANFNFPNNIHEI